MLANLSSKHSWHRSYKHYQSSTKLLQKRSRNHESMFLVQQNVRSPKLGWFDLFSTSGLDSFFFQDCSFEVSKYLLRISGTIASFKVKYTNIYFWELIHPWVGDHRETWTLLRHTLQFCEMAKANLQDGWLIARLIFFYIKLYSTQLNNHNFTHRFFLRGFFMSRIPSHLIFWGEKRRQKLHQTWRPSGKITNERTHWTGPTPKRPEYWDVHGS